MNAYPNIHGRAARLVIALALTIALSTPSGAQLGNLTPPGGPINPVGKTTDEIEPRVPISQLPFVVNASGSYFLTATLTGANGLSGITINADDVALDLNGFTLLGVPGSLNGIEVAAPALALAVTNGTVANWGGTGIEAQLCNLTTVSDVRVRSSGAVGVSARAANLYDATITGNASHGVVLADPSLHCITERCTISENGGDGVNFAMSSTAVKWKAETCAIRGNAGYGIRIVDGSPPQVDGGATIYWCDVEDNDLGGAWCDMTSPGGGWTLTSAISRFGDNTGSGLRFSSSALGSRFYLTTDSVHASGNSVNGVQIDLSTSNSAFVGEVSNSTFDANSNHNFVIASPGLSTSSELRVTNSSFTRAAAGGGLRIESGLTLDGTLAVDGSTFSRNATDGLAYAGGGRLSLRCGSCTLTGNGNRGFSYAGGGGTISIRASLFELHGSANMFVSGAESVRLENNTVSDAPIGTELENSIPGARMAIYCGTSNYLRCGTGFSCSSSALDSYCEVGMHRCIYTDNSVSHSRCVSSAGGRISLRCFDCSASEGGVGYECGTNGGHYSCYLQGCSAIYCSVGFQCSATSATARCYSSSVRCRYENCGTGYECAANDSECDSECDDTHAVSCGTGYRMAYANGSSGICRGSGSSARSCNFEGMLCTSDATSSCEFRYHRWSWDRNVTDGCRLEVNGGSNARFHSCGAARNGANGLAYIDTTGTGSVEAESCDLMDNNADGMLSDGANLCRSSRCTSSRNANGLTCTNTNTTDVSGSDIKNNNNAGINAGAGVSKVTVRDSTVVGNAGAQVALATNPVVFVWRCRTQAPVIGIGAPGAGSDVAPVNNPSVAGPNDNINCP